MASNNEVERRGGCVADQRARLGGDAALTLHSETKGVPVALFPSIRIFLMAPNPVAFPTLFKVSRIFLMARRTDPDGEWILLRAVALSARSLVEGEYDEGRKQKDEHGIWTGADNPVWSKLWRICEPNRSARV
jgi:hypothetical protein